MRNDRDFWPWFSVIIQQYCRVFVQVLQVVSSSKGSHFIKERALISGRLANVHVRQLFNQRHSRCWSFLLSSNRLVVHSRR